MLDAHLKKISSELRLLDSHVVAVSELLADGCTVPFIARYRKEATGSMDEVAVTAIRDRQEQLTKLDERREAVLRSLMDRELLTPELEAAVAGAGTLQVLEDIYLPFRPKRRTRAMKAREAGLQPLADRIIAQEGGDPDRYAEEFVNPETGIASVEDALKGACDILAEELTEVPETREAVRSLFWSKGSWMSRLVPGKESEGSRFRDYFEWDEPVRRAPSHRVLAMRRGEEKGILSLAVSVPMEEVLETVAGKRLKNRSTREGTLIIEASRDGCRRLLAPSIETDTRLRSKEEADAEAIRVFALNLRRLLLAAPLGRRPIMALDPGFRTGCKTVCLDSQGALRDWTTIQPFRSAGEREKAAETVRRLAQKHGIDFIAVGNGTAGRETESFLAEAGLPAGITILQVNESGASIYSASEAAREEFPDHDITVRGAVSIGRRLQDPLAELVKLDPKSIGVGQYQHDVDQGMLKRALDTVVESCVNTVGVEVNTASRQLLSYVSGLSPSIAANVAAYREAHGPFVSRRQLLEVPRLGPKAFEQCAGFLRIRDGAEPLDASAVHPESYRVVRSMALSTGCSVTDLMGSEELRRSLRLEDFMDDRTGLPTLMDIMDELEKPGRDPRETFQPFRFADVHEMKNLEEGMVLPGIVTNVTNFGAFIDVGVHQDGLVHISQMADHRITSPSEAASVGDRVKVRVLEVDMERGRISLSMRDLP
jgi:protein Tex